ncbi:MULTISPECIES: amino acid ABC transporter permease [unclassified Enterococcus]|uniref:amino acid ABC transporter permease n=1 Tax=unclassified Enterococcus TaxID=2608891 RepID=UPI001556838B|nr:MULTISPECIES: amino acid ABC transporter permease [unclassified Enterococcus]MBS7577302.1 amino acid ABC transporter permease [Enterococcus sp. MMGLQ5-2]MBS7584605.1 amino acid ABC transporter permease [Enterococcus sp. MMGLQ5-1]NPD12460.1 amino acid ABC transporter permease [Enterococcus sp. MMGLQ5-1]NPD37136.1 amino acid ABC transporter permease [Enterococcus sp. MMGLQ5-2]
MNFDFLPKYLPYFTDGLVFTVIISILVVSFGTIFGVILALMKLSKNVILKAIANVYIEFFRGTPMVVQIMFAFVLTKVSLPTVHFGILSVGLDRLVPGILVMAMNSGAYVAEIIRGGILSINKGQTEAAYSLGLKPNLTLRYVILPQAIRNILPALGNEFVVIIKDSSLLSTIGVMELYNGTQTVMNASYNQIGPLFFVCILYFILTFVTTRLIGLGEKRLGRGYQR